MVLNGVSEPANLRLQLRRNRRNAQPFKSVHQRMPKAVQPVAMRNNAFALYIVKHLAHLLRRKFVVIEKRNELDDRPLKINVVFPKRIVRVDEKGLGKQFLAL